MARILIKNGRVFDGARFVQADVLTDGDRIARIEPDVTEPADLVFDATGKTVCAGLVDAHVHLRGISTDKFGTPADLATIPFGVTAAADASGEQGNRELLDSFTVKGAVFAKARFRENRADLQKTKERIALFGDRAVGVKVYFDTTMSDVTDTAPLREVCDFAHERGLIVMVHCANSPTKMVDILQTLGTGDILTHAFHGGAQNAAVDDFESMRKAQARGVIIDVGFAGHVHTDFAILQRALQNGIVPDLISTDITCLSAYKRGGRYGMTMCMSIARALGMREEEIFRAVTVSPAKALGRSAEWGLLQPGRAADVAVFELADEPFDLTDKAGNRVCGREGYRCVLTLCDGQVAYKG